jgi:hypothetical protein
MLYEYRFYEANEGKLEALDRRFRDLTWRVMQRHGFEQVGFWTPEGTNQLVYILKWRDKVHSESAWKAFQGDPEWQQGKAASEVDGPLLARTSTQFWNPLEYSEAR